MTGRFKLLFGDSGTVSPERAFFSKALVLVAVPTVGFDLTRLCPLAGGFPFLPDFLGGPSGIGALESNTAERKSGSFISAESCFLNAAAPSRSACEVYDNE